MKNETIEVGTSKWLVKEAVSIEAAQRAIGTARATGATGARQFENDTLIAEVVRLNDDGTERKPG